jgi:hypothetical protein
MFPKLMHYPLLCYTIVLAVALAIAGHPFAALMIGAVATSGYCFRRAVDWLEDRPGEHPDRYTR